MVIKDLSLIAMPAIGAMVLSLGSNHQSETSFETAFGLLDGLGGFVASDITTSQDHTGKTNTIYHNACVLLTLDKWWDFCGLASRLKHIEHLCGTSWLLKQQNVVPMDIDVLAVKAQNDWQISQRRLPFKQHELMGLTQIAPFLCEMSH
ncbi:MAG: hypothetical protein Q4A69_02990 [Moraxella sp.]|nr:hypothetical protein [Moraxella sp.]